MTGSNYNVEVSELGKWHTFICDVCSHPTQRSYRWTFNDIILGHNSKLKVLIDDMAFYGNYTCRVSNVIKGVKHTTDIIYHLRQKGEQAEWPKND